MCSLKNKIVCRACLNDSSTIALVSIFKAGLRESFEDCTSLTVTEDDFYPKHLCINCCDIVKSFTDFREKCAQSQLNWKSYYDADTLEENVKEPTKVISKTELDLNLEFDEDEYGFPELSDTDLRSSEQNNVHIITRAWKKENKFDTDFKGQCEKCKKKFRCKQELIKNVKHCYKVPKSSPPQTVESFFCGICNEKPKTKSETQRHLLTHLDSGSLDCKMCNYIALDFADLLVHRFLHKPEGEKCVMFCIKCPKYYRVPSRLEFHYRAVHLKKSRPGVCKECKKEFTNYNHFMVHLLMHTGKVFECEICHNTFKYEKSLRKHMVTHSGVKRYMCDLCGYSCHRPSNLRSHNYRRHNKHEPILCQDCGKSYKNKESLQDHMVRNHTYKNIPCPICGKLYKRENEMMLHKKWHSDERPYVCDTCGRSYKAKQQLKIHMRVHTGERPFKCGICDMTFPQNNSLKKHALIHTGEKPHMCGICGRKFAAKNNMKKHQLRHKGSLAKPDRY